MEPRKRKIYKYFAVPCGSSVIIYRTVGTLRLVKSILRLPKLPDSPRYYIDGTVNKGTIFSQLCYTGGSLVGTIDNRTYTRRIGTTPFKITRLNLAQKRAVQKLLEEIANERPEYID